MGLGVSLNNALTGLNVGQDSLDILSRNVANAGKPGYHRQSLSVIDTMGVNSVFARTGGVERAFNASLQAHYTRAISDASFSATRANILNQLQTYLGKPGDPGGLDTMFSSLENAVQQLGTSPDNYATRASVVSQAQAMSSTLNALTKQVQGLRQETEVQIKSTVDQLNQAVSSLAKINLRIGDQSTDSSSRASLLDQRDRLVAQIAETIDVRVDYRSDDTVSLMTRSGVGILDNKASVFGFNSVGALSATSQYSADPDKNSVGVLTLDTPGGLSLNLVQQGVLKSGSLSALLELRDKSLNVAQGQLDEIAGALAQVFSTVQTDGTAASSGAATGFDLDISAIRDGNDFVVNYTRNGVEKAVKVVRVDDTTKLPIDYVDANNVRVVGMDFSGGAAAVASALGLALGSGFAVTSSGSTVRVLDDGNANSTDVNGMVARTTATGIQNGDLGFSLFVDSTGADFTNSLSGDGQKLGFAGRISVNSAIVADNKLLVQYQAGGSLGDATRANYVMDQFRDMKFASGQVGGAPPGFRLGGTISDLVSQAIDYQGLAASTAAGDDETQQLTLSTISERVDSEYGVNVDEEMARLMELQNAYAANARVISVVQDLLGRLMDL